MVLVRLKIAAVTVLGFGLLGTASVATYQTQRPDEKRREAEPGPDRERRQARMDELKDARFVDEDTALPAVPAWWHTLEDERAQSEIDHLGGAELAADWGQRILSERSHLYDPLSYHYGSVWPLFTGWTAMAAYRYGRPHVGLQALMANALLRSRSALGYVTELLSGDYDTPFGRSPLPSRSSCWLVVSSCRRSRVWSPWSSLAACKPRSLE